MGGRDQLTAFLKALLTAIESTPHAAVVYRRSDALEKRRKLMEAWAAYCERSNSNNIVKLSNRKH